MSQTKTLKAFIQYDVRGRAVPSSILLRESIPKGGNFRELVDPNTYKCCPDYRSFSTESFPMCPGFVGLMIQVTPESEPLIIGNLIEVLLGSDPVVITAALNVLYAGFAIFELIVVTNEEGTTHYYNITLIADTYIGIKFYNSTDCSPT